jgi:putative tricarboxylic transport membrane protein
MIFSEYLLNLFWLLSGGITGIVVGLLPGFGVLSAVSMFVLFFVLTDPLNILIFYIGLIVSTQYMGSVTATLLGIPGETTSIPASISGFKMFKEKKGTQALVLAAQGSLFASLFAVAILVAAIFILQQQYWMYSQKLYFFIFMCILFYLVFINKNILINFILIILGLFLGAIGQNPLERLSLTFNQNWLLPGLDYRIFIILAFTLPTLMIFFKKKIKNENFVGELKNIEFIEKVRIFKNNFLACLRGTMIGVFAGLVPGVGTSLCSNFAWTLERKIKSDDAKQLISAESANNSANISSLFPVIILGLPILASEAIILNLMEMRAGLISFDWFLSNQNGYPRFFYVILSAVLITLIVYVAATRFAKSLCIIVNRIPNNIIIYTIPIALTLIFLYLNYLDLTLSCGLLTVLISLIICYFCVRFKIDSSPLIFSFLISQKFLQTIYVFLSL